MPERWTRRAAGRAAWLSLVVLAGGCRAAEPEREPERDVPPEVAVWEGLRVDRGSIGPDGFRVEGLPPGWRARLVPWWTQGINPRILFADLQLVPGEPRPDEDPQAAAWVPCELGYEEVWVVAPGGWVRIRS